MNLMMILRKMDNFIDKFELSKVDKTKFLRYFTVLNNREVIPETRLYTEISTM